MTFPTGFTGGPGEPGPPGELGEPGEPVKPGKPVEPGGKKPPVTRARHGGLFAACAAETGR